MSAPLPFLPRTGGHTVLHGPCGYPSGQLPRVECGAAGRGRLQPRDLRRPSMQAGAAASGVSRNEATTRVALLRVPMTWSVLIGHLAVCPAAQQSAVGLLRWLPQQRRRYGHSAVLPCCPLASLNARCLHACMPQAPPCVCSLEFPASCALRSCPLPTPRICFPFCAPAPQIRVPRLPEPLGFPSLHGAPAAGTGAPARASSSSGSSSGRPPAGGPRRSGGCSRPCWRGRGRRGGEWGQQRGHGSGSRRGSSGDTATYGADSR